MYLAADPLEALYLGLREEYVNSFDAITEVQQENGEVEVTIDSKNRRVTVKDNGPGIPNKIQDDGTHSVYNAFTVSHTGSHFDGRAVNAIGTHGIGAKAVCHTSSLMEIMNHDGKTAYNVRFESNDDGAYLSGEIKEKRTSHGLTVMYVPDKQIYGDEWFEEEELKKAFAEMMKFYPKIKLTLNFDGRKSTFHVPNGLKEPNTKMYYESPSLIISLSVADDDSQLVKPYCNRLHLPIGGKFFTQFKTTMTRQVNSLSGLKLKGDQVQSQFSGYICIFVQEPLFSAQAKTAVANTEVNLEINRALTELLKEFSETKEWERMIKLLEGEIKAEQAAEAARKKVKDALDGIRKGSKKKVAISEKLKDCINSGKGTWLCISEGDSANGALIMGRDQENVALFPIRGKFINTLKNSKEVYLSNEELQQISQILGCGLFEEFDVRKLRYENVLIAVDADSDGLNIADLLITYFYVCMPDFIKEGHLYWMRAPLYVNSDTKSYIFTEEEWKKVKNKKGYTRCKGLGEMQPQQVKDSLFGADKRWEQLKPRNWKTFSDLIEKLMGKDVESRRDYIFNNIDFENITFM